MIQNISTIHRNNIIQFLWNPQLNDLAEWDLFLCPLVHIEAPYGEFSKEVDYKITKRFTHVYWYPTVEQVANICMGLGVTFHTDENRAYVSFKTVPRRMHWGEVDENVNVAAQKLLISLIEKFNGLDPDVTNGFVKLTQPMIKLGYYRKNLKI